MHNPYIEFLRRYGPVPASDNLYDETIQSSARRLGIRPIEVPLEELDTLVDNFQGSAPHSVILTGTAGDGKTFLCRQIWSRLGGEPKAWERCDKIHTLPLSAAGKELLIIKDLSELTPQQKDQYLPQMAAAISGADSQTVYLLAANDGQLVASLQRAAEVDGANAEQLKKLVEELLVTDRQQAEGYALKLFNLSRNHAPSLLDKILDEIVQHNDWEHCTECPHHRDGPARCPIYENRMRLMPSEDNRFRLRLRALLELAEANRLHLPIRHLLMLSVNILLGNEDAGGGLMTCKQAIECIADATTAKASPYSNVFGSNLAAKKRQQHLCFSVLDSFGIGRETSNTVDDLLVYGRDSNILLTAYQQLVGDDTYYGASKYYETQRGRYVEGFRENGDGAKLLDLLPAQRQRLFFTAAQESNGKFSPWMLTVYHFAGDFLAMRTALEQTQSVAVHLAALITGFNRVFTGMMVEEPHTLLVTSSGGDGRGRLSFVLETEIPVEDDEGVGREIRLILAPGQRLPTLEVALAHDKTESLELTLTLYEYLRRIAEGSLPTSFSHQCFEDLLGFKLRLLEARNTLVKSTSSRLTFRFIHVDEDGKVKPHRIQVDRQ